MTSLFLRTLIRGFVVYYILEKNQYINAKLFGKLLDEGGTGLVGTYVMLLKSRDGYHCYNTLSNKNNKITKGKRLISKHSGVSLSALERYLPTLIEMGLCSHMKNGGFFLVGSKKINQNYNSSKKVSVRVGKNLRETKGNVNAVLVIANLRRQYKFIDKKITLNKALCQEAKGKTLDSTQVKLILKANKNSFIDITNLKKVENVVLSNKGISNVITGAITDEGHKAVSKGGYWRKVLQRRGFIYSRRRFKTIWAEKISYTTYLSMREWFYENHGFVTYKNGRVVKPIVSEVMVLDNTVSTYNSKYILNSYSKSIGGGKSFS